MLKEVTPYNNSSYNTGNPWCLCEEAVTFLVDIRQLWAWRSWGRFVGNYDELKTA